MWRRLVLAAFGFASMTLLGGGGVAAQTADAPVIWTFSQYLRSNGYNISDAESQFLDADEQIQAVFTQTLVNVDLLSRAEAAMRNDDWRQALVGELRRLVNMDPNAAPVAPASLQRLRDLGVDQRLHMWRAARAWLDAVEAGDPEWLQRGSEEFRYGMAGMSSWQQELVSRYPPPQPEP